MYKYKFITPIEAVVLSSLFLIVYAMIFAEPREEIKFRCDNHGHEVTSDKLTEYSDEHGCSVWGVVRDGEGNE